MTFVTARGFRYLINHTLLINNNITSLHEGYQKVLGWMMILLEARNKAKAGTEDHHDAAGKAGVPHVGDLVQFQVKPPGVRGGDSVARVS